MAPGGLNERREAEPKVEAGHRAVLDEASKISKEVDKTVERLKEMGMTKSYIQIYIYFKKKYMYIFI